jgi:DNA-binding beta-propeller fold protein YncE
VVLVSTPTVPLDPTDPRRLGPYTIERRIGTGGMGVVYLGRDRTGRRAAVKVVHAHLADDPAFRDRFTHEIATASAVRAPWTAAVVAADATARRPWLATEFVDGPDLDRAVATTGSLPRPGLMLLAAALFEALAALHARRVVHRDVKPANVLLAPDGPRLIDFGIARALDATAVTGTGHAVGTPAYMSPEQATGEDTGPPSDVFSLAAVLTFAATGRGPFGVAPNPGAMLLRIADAEPDLTGVPGELRQVLSACLAKEPGLRPASWQLAAEFARHRPAAPPLPPPGRVVASGRRRRRVWAAVAATALVVVAAIVAVTTLLPRGGAAVDLSRGPVPTAGPAPAAPRPATVTRSVPVGKIPEQIVVGPDGRAYVTTADGISVIDPTTGTTITRVDAQSRPVGIALGADGRKLFVCSISGAVATLELPAFVTAGNVVVGQQTFQFAAAPTAQRIYLQDTARNVVLAFDMATGTVTGETPVSVDTHALAAGPDGRSLWARDTKAGTWTVFDPATGATRATIPSGSFGDPVAFSPDGTRAYIKGGTGLNAVTVVDTTTWKSIGEFRLDETGSIRNLAITPDGRYLFASMLTTSTDGPEILIIDASTHAIEQGLELTGEADHMAVSPDGGTLYAADFDAGAVHMIDIGGYR